MAKIKHCESILPSIKGMKVGQKISFPISRQSVVRTTSSAYGVESGRSYSVMRDRENALVIVTRNS